jgi:hypothetical protein
VRIWPLSSLIIFALQTSLSLCRAADQSASYVLTSPCQDLLGREILATPLDSFRTLSEWNESLAPFEEATVLVRLSLGRNVYPLSRLSVFLDDLNVKYLPDLNMIGARSIFFLLQDSPKNMKSVPVALPNLFDARDLSFRVLMGRTSHGVHAAPDIDPELARLLKSCLYDDCGGLRLTSRRSSDINEKRPSATEIIRPQPPAPIGPGQIMRILDFLLLRAGPDFTGELTTKYGLRELFLSVFREMAPPKQLTSMEERLNVIPFTPTDHTALLRPGAAQERFQQAWRIWVDTVLPGQTHEPFDDHVLSLLEQNFPPQEINVETAVRFEMAMRSNSLPVGKAQRILGILRDCLGKSELESTGLQCALIELASRFWTDQNRNQVRELLAGIEFQPSDFDLIMRPRQVQGAVTSLEIGWRVLAALAGVRLGPKIDAEDIAKVEKALKKRP